MAWWGRKPDVRKFGDSVAGSGKSHCKTCCRKPECLEGRMLREARASGWGSEESTAAFERLGFWLSKRWVFGGLHKVSLDIIVLSELGFLLLWETPWWQQLLQRKTFKQDWLTAPRFSPYCHDKEYGGMRADMVLEKDLRVLHLDLQAAGRDSESLGLAWASETSKCSPSNTSSNKVTPTPQDHTS